MRWVFFNHDAGVVHDALENMKEIHKILVRCDRLILALLVDLWEQLCPDVFKGLDIHINGSYGFVHLDDLLQDVVLLSLFNES